MRKVRLSIEITGTNRFLNGNTMVYGIAKTAGTEENPLGLTFKVEAKSPSGPETPATIDNVSRVVLVAEGTVKKLDQKKKEIYLEDCIFHLKAGLPDKPAKIVKKTGKPTKKSKKEYDLRQRDYLGYIFQLAGITTPHIKADKLYSSLPRLKHIIPELEKSIGSDEPLYKRPWALIILDMIPELFEMMEYSPADTDKIMKQLDRFDDYKDMPFRYAVWGNYILGNLQGDTFMDTEDFLVRIKEKTNSTREIEDIRNSLIGEGIARFSFDERIVFLNAIRKAEYGIAQKLRSICKEFSQRQENQPQDISWDIALSEEQKLAVSGCCSLYEKGGVAIITGGPGTGKTTILKAIISTLLKMGVDKDDIALAAPTGKAAKRIEDVTGSKAQTIHRLLEVDPIRGINCFQRNETNPLGQRVVIIDEASMIDTLLFKNLLWAVKPDTGVILLGDPDQLESVGPGSVLSDLGQTNQKILKYHLNQNFRQIQGSLIMENAYRIIHKETSLLYDRTFELIRIEKKEDIHRAITHLKGVDVINDPNTIVLTHSNEDSWNVNKNILQELKEDGVKCQIFENRRFYQKEKVIFSQNNYSHMNCKTLYPKDRDNAEPCPYYNGETGYIKSMVNSVGLQEQCITVKTPDKTVRLFPKNYNDISPAYGITVHRAEGSEYNTVIIYIPRSAYTDRSWLYTAVTRAKKRVVIISERDALEECISRERKQRRTMLTKELTANGLIDEADGKRTPVPTEGRQMTIWDYYYPDQSEQDD